MGDRDASASPSGVVFVRKSHRFILIRYSPATQRSDLVLFQAETSPGEARFLYSAPGDFGTLAISQNGEWLLVGWVNANQWLFLRLTSAKVESVSNIVEQFGGSPRAPLEKAFPSSVSGVVPRRPDPLRRRRGRSSGAVQAIDRADPVAPVAVGRPAVGRAARPGRAASG